MVRRCICISEGIRAQSIGFAEKEAQLFDFDDSNRSSEYLHSYNHVRTRRRRRTWPEERETETTTIISSSASVTAACMCMYRAGPTTTIQVSILHANHSSCAP